MLTVTARLGQGREIGPDDFTEFTPVAVTGVAFVAGGWLQVTFAADVDEQVARKVRRRIVSQDTIEEDLRKDIWQAHLVIGTWTPLINPTLEQVLARQELLAAQVRRTTKLNLLADEWEPPAPPPAP